MDKATIVTAILQDQRPSSIGAALQAKMQERLGKNKDGKKV